MAPPSAELAPLDVRVRCRGGRPWRGAVVRLSREGATRETPTDASGHARFDDVAVDGSTVVSVMGRYSDREGRPATRTVQLGYDEPERTVRTSSVDIEIRNLVPTRVEFRDAETGEQIAGRACAWTGAFDGDDDQAVVVEVTRVGRAWVDIGIVDPGTGRLRDRTPTPLCVSPYATECLLVVPVHREASIIVIPTVDGEPASDVTVARVKLGREELKSWRAEADPGHGIRLRGVPFLRGAHVDVEVSTTVRGEKVRPTATGELPDAAGQVLTLQLALGSPFFNNASDIDIRGGRPENHFEMTADGWLSFSPSVLPAAKDGRRVQVRRVDGTPAVAALVLVQGDPDSAGGSTELRWETNDVGETALPISLTGTRRIQILQHGFIGAEVHADLSSDVVAPLVITEGASGSLEIEVVDESGAAIPYASIAVDQASWQRWVDLDGCVQRLDGFTDERGRRTIHHVDAQGARVVATYGDRAEGVRLDAGWVDTLPRQPIRMVLR